MKSKNFYAPCMFAAVVLAGSGSVVAAEEGNAADGAAAETVAGDTTPAAGFDKLLDALIGQGVLTRAQADAVLQSIRDNGKAAADEEVDPATVRVPYVPEFIQEKIRADVRGDLHQEVVDDVMERARVEGWGLPGVLPDWVNRIRWKGDVRLRAQGDLFADGNIAPPLGYYNFPAINAAGGGPRTRAQDQFLNSTEDRTRLRARARLGLEARPADTLLIGLRLTTGTTTDPVSTNQTLGVNANRYSVTWDQLYLQYKAPAVAGDPWLTLWGGRMPNPWFSSDLVWDADLGFEGVAAKYTYGLPGAVPEYGKMRNLFFTVGAFPLQEVELSSHDKWLYGAQLGIDLDRRGWSRFRAALAYYYFDNIAGRRNALDSTLLDFTAPGYMQKGNLLFDIRNDSDPTTDLWALAADYHELNLSLEYDLIPRALFHYTVNFDYVKNLGYDEHEIRARTGGAVNNSQGFSDPDLIEGHTDGYQLKLTVGQVPVRARGDWQVSGGYRYLESDAVLDAYTDSDFHLGGTDAKGWFIGAEYGLMNDTWLSARWLSADEIDGAPMGVDVVQIDVNARF